MTSYIYSEEAMELRSKTNSKNIFPRLQLELGGKDPCYVRHDIEGNAEVIGEGIADGAMFNAGQSCCSVERVYVHSSQ